MAVFPTEIWTLVLDHMTTRDEAGKLSLPCSLNLLTLIFAVHGSEETMATCGLRELLNERWQEAVRHMHMHADIAMEKTRYDYLASERAFRPMNPGRREWWPSDVLAAVEKHYSGVTGLFYWRVGMATPENLVCLYDVTQTQWDLARRCTRAILNSGVPCPLAKFRDLFTDHPFEHSEPVDADMLATHDPAVLHHAWETRGLQMMQEYVERVISREEPFDRTKSELRYHARAIEGDPTRYLVDVCQRPNCPMCIPIRAYWQ